MIQQLLVMLIRTITSTFFRRVDVAGLENVPVNGPVIFAGNHPNALMDGWLLTATCGRRPLHFLVNSKLWDYRLLAPVLDATGAIPVYRREEHDGEVDNTKAFERVYEVLATGHCIGIFPEGVSHAEAHLVKLKTGAARIALSAVARGCEDVYIVPCGLNYIHRHRFRSQVLIEYGRPIAIDERWMLDYQRDEKETTVRLTDELARALTGVTLNAPDWRTLRFIQTARRLYKPSTAVLSPGDYVELSRRFVDGYLASADDPELLAFRDEVENYQARLDLLGFKDYQLRQPLRLRETFRKVLVRSLTMLALLPVAIPGAILHLPVGWIAATVGERFSYEMDDIATLKVFATVLLLPVIYLIIAIVVATNFGIWWAIVTIALLSFSFLTSVRLIEAEAGLLNSILSLLRLARLGSEVEDLRKMRAALVAKVRDLAERHADPDLQRMFTDEDFGGGTLRGGRNRRSS